MLYHGLGILALKYQGSRHSSSRIRFVVRNSTLWPSLFIFRLISCIQFHFLFLLSNVPPLFLCSCPSRLFFVFPFPKRWKQQISLLLTHPFVSDRRSSPSPCFLWLVETWLWVWLSGLSHSADTPPFRQYPSECAFIIHLYVYTHIQPSVS